MSYILDALIASEQEWGNRKARGLLEKPVDVTITALPVAWKTSPRWLLFIAFALLLNASFFVFWLHPWPWGGNANVFTSRISDREFPKIRQQEASVIPPEPLTQLQVNQQAPESRAEEWENSVPNPPVSDVVAAVSAGPSTSGKRTHGAVQDRIVESKPPSKDQEATPNLEAEPVRTNQASVQFPPTTAGISIKNKAPVKEPHGSKLPRKAKAAGSKMSQIEAQNIQALRNEQPLRAAAGNISEIQPLAEQRTSLGKPAGLQEPEWHDLAPQVRAALPSLAISILIYSKKPVNRWISVDGSKKREGEEISTGLKLDEITPNGAIFSYQGHRFYKSIVGN